MDFIQKLGDHKMNVYQLHSSDDQGYSMPSKAYPHLPNPRLALSQAEAEALQAKAVELHVQIVAEVDLPVRAHGSACVDSPVFSLSCNIFKCFVSVSLSLSCSSASHPCMHCHASVNIH